MTESNESDIHNLILGNGWKQGVVLPASELVKIGIDTCGSCDYWVVVSQVCDIAHGDINSEPTIELLGGKRLTEIKGHLENLRNPRKLHQTHTKNNNELHIEFNIVNRQFIDRRICIDNKLPNNHYTLSISQLDEVITLFLNRYKRPAFPDEFENRLSVNSVSKKIKNILKGSVKALEGIYFRITPESELSENEEYHVNVLALIDSLSFKEEDTKKANKAFSDYVEVLKKAKGIKVIHHQVYDPNTFTVTMEREFKKYNFDYVSFQQS